MRTISLLSLIAAAAAAVAMGVAGCGDDGSAPADTSGGSAPAGTSGDARATKTSDEAARSDTSADSAGEKRGATITLQDSNFGPMLFDSNKQAIYVFERDSRNETVCYGECADAWPPVFTDGPPHAGKGVRASLLGTVKRRDGRAQVTYAGKPLYFYAHEGPGVVLCHNVNLNGGYWWAIGADGTPRPA